ncbi:MAG: 50S ribosomal protein L16 [candidate division WS6 bacterium GW2011_GWA2_37_6]|uniref:Large ribosomal subunit protein uL16 n=1 Tax=candidate division WS6 bacterium GW2011_GWA2_37_6 TaxID=1619087 RepID=A0A0G0GY36_9BACT|nr:MAG: 50S ribosomal protein L16 [candidate division WS6 bacterium GW2011_GWA2_37_6]
MLQPKRTKYRKEFRGRMKGSDIRGSQISVGEFGLKAMTRAWVTAKQLESARKAIVRETKRKGKLWLRVFPQKPYTKKPDEVGMGKGKGDVEGYVFVVKPGRILFELGGVDEYVAMSAFKRAADKLPIRTRIIKKD